MRALRFLGTASLLLVAMLVVTAPASAHRVSYARGVHGSFKPASGPPFTSVGGDVTSNNKSCRRNLTVYLWQSQVGSDVKIGSTRTNSKGKWHIDQPIGFPSGTYYVTVAKRILVKNQFHHHICPGLKTTSFSF
ncbi:MAG: hypothetical protein EXQ70_04595 [Solirubrobacterales bacterium]|nr:hypothetical protein [Solirubrobacterales bacterium]